MTWLRGLLTVVSLLTGGLVAAFFCWDRNGWIATPIRCWAILAGHQRPKHAHCTRN